ncbi:MAG TPA: large conductance mechanosensitive channel protein MscL [Chloroflexota bacterium]|nr:large conductance mechanosensitive channel protein MscL [Chloroflexota bacterium]HUM72181.1 large conductance mechanosensitive channel protein MscL [Chloroflexota bacterium]
MVKEFQEFLSRGNVMDLAVAVILGAAFTAIVNSLVNDIIMPLIGALLGGLSFTELTVQVGDAVIAYGNFIQAIVNFIIIAFVIFMIVRYYNRMARKKDEAPATPPTPPEDVILLREIRDLLKK